MATAEKALKPGIEVVGVQAELYPSMYAKLRGLKLPCEGDTLAEGIAVKQPGDTTFEIVRDLVDDIALVAERDLAKALSLLLTVEKTVVVGAGAAGLAALPAPPGGFPARTVGVLTCAGNTTTPF